MNAADVMTTELATLHPTDSVADAIRLMVDRHISGVPVLNGKRELVGMLTEGDLLRRSEIGTERERPRWLEFLMSSGRLAEDYVRTHARKVEEIMTTNVASVSPDTPLREVVRLMQTRHVKRVPIVHDGVCVGIVSRADLVRVLGRLLAERAAAPAGDDAIREYIVAELGRTSWGPRRSIDVSVDNGVVNLDGVIFDERERQGVRVIAENAPGVKQVVDRLTWMEPTTGITFDAEELDRGKQRNS